MAKESVSIEQPKSVEYLKNSRLGHECDIKQTIIRYCAGCLPIAVSRSNANAHSALLDMFSTEAKFKNRAHPLEYE